MSEVFVSTVKTHRKTRLNAGPEYSGSLFDTLSHKLEEHVNAFKSRSASTRSPTDSDLEEKETNASVLTPQKLTMFDDHTYDLKEALLSLGSPLQFTPKKQDIQLLEQVKSEGRACAVQLSLKLQRITQRTVMEGKKVIQISDFVKQFDKCFEMIEVLQNTHQQIESSLLEFEKARLELEDEQHSSQKLYNLYTKEVLDNCPCAKSLCDVISSLLPTSLFENESQSTIENLIALSNLSKNPGTDQKSNTIRASVLEYNEILNRINGYSNDQDRLTIVLSASFLEGFKFKHSKGKRQK